MPQPPRLIKLALLSFASWAFTLAFYFVGIVVTAASLQHAQASTAEVAVIILVVAELLAACLSIAFVFSRSRGHFQAAAMRFFWVAVFVLLQLGTCALAAFASLLALNR